MVPLGRRCRYPCASIRNKFIIYINIVENTVESVKTSPRPITVRFAPPCGVFITGVYVAGSLFYTAEKPHNHAKYRFLSKRNGKQNFPQ